MKVAIAQINTTVGDLSGNVERALGFITRAADASVGLVVFPELTISGYPPRDILLDESFIEAAGLALQDLAVRADGLPPVLVGAFVPSGLATPNHPGLYNAAFLLQNGTARMVAAKRLLPAYDVFHEPRWFTSGDFHPPFELAGRQIGVLLCEDLWDEGYPTHPPAELIAAGADMLVCLSASPYRHDVLEKRLYHASRPGLPIVYANLCGATDELIFDGRSFVLDAAGNVLAHSAAFDEELTICNLSDAVAVAPDVTAHEALNFSALTLGIHDFAHKNHLKRAVLGLSGGIDSALVAVLAAAALGPENVTGVALPSRYSDARSTSSARELAEALGIHFEVVELEAMHAAVETALGAVMGDGTGAENAQARLRMLALMAFVNQQGGFLLNTSNKTELTLGYSTLYGDQAGALSPLGDLTKPEVYALAHWVNVNQGGVIPSFILERAPSAELKPGQVDPFDYGKLSPRLEELVQANQSNRVMQASEHKRWQAGIILKVSEKSFGTGRMMPVTRR